jgi:hypothetical protein
MSLRRKTSVNSVNKKSPRPLTTDLPSHKSTPRSSPKTAQLASAESVVEFFLAAPAVATASSEPSTGANSAHNKVEQAKRSLGDLECEVISALFPANGAPESMESIAIRLGMSVQEVRSLADSALRGLRGSKGPLPRPSSVWN